MSNKISIVLTISLYVCGVVKCITVFWEHGDAAEIRLIGGIVLLLLADATARRRK